MVDNEYNEVVSPLLLHGASLKVLYLGVVTRERIPTAATNHHHRHTHTHQHPPRKITG